MAKKTDKRVIAAYTKLSALPGEENKPEKQPKTYFDSRMAAIGVTNAKEHSFSIPRPAPANEFWQPIFAKTENDDIKIYYPNLYGGEETYFDADSNEQLPYYRIRINPDRQRDGKYIQPPKSGTHIFFPVTILDKFAKGEKIETLYVVEGELKAQSASRFIDIIGIPGKDQFTQKDEGLHEDIVAIIQKCDVQNLVLLLDADVFALDWDVEAEPDKNLAKRTFSFYNTVIRWREMAKTRVRDAYFAHISERFLDDAKGLDDLLLYKKGSEHEVITDLQKLKLAKVFFNCINVTVDTAAKVKSYFGLNFYRGVPNTFYARHAEIIKEHEFNFNGARFRFDKEKGLQLSRHADSFKFIRVGCDYFKEIQVPDVHGHMERKLVSWKSGEITRDFVNAGYKNFFETIDKYEAFCNVPENDPEKYQRTINGCYNMYFKLEHAPTEGTHPYTTKFIKHLFGEAKLKSGFTNFDLAMDWLTLLYTKPIEKLPAICLVSSEKRTGKSTFLWWLREIFNENATVIGNKEISDTYNDDFISKLLIGIDESFIEKKLIIEQIKTMVTNSKAKMHGKYASRHDVPFVGHFVMTSNNEKNFIAIDDDENRFWINKVPVFPKEQQDPDLLGKMVEEIPAFLHTLNTRKVLHPRVDRLWFDSDLLETDASRTVKNNSKTWLEKEIKSTMEEQFFIYQYHTLCYTITQLMQLFNSDGGAKYRKDAVQEALEEKFGIIQRAGRYIFPQLPNMSNIIERGFDNCNGRYYEFKVEQFLSEDKIESQFTYFKRSEIENYRQTEIAAFAGLDDEIM